MRIRKREARALAERARAESRRGAADRAIVLYDRALALFDGVSDELAVNILRWKGTAYAETGRTQAAREMYEQSVAAAESLGAVAAQAEGVNALGSIAQRRGALDEAEELYRRAAELAMSADAHPVLGRICQNQGILAAIRGNWEHALERYQTSVREFELADDEEAISWGLNNLGKLCTEQARYLEAEAVFEWGLRIARSRSSRLVEGLLELNRAELMIATGRLGEARDACGRSLSLATKRRDPLRRAEALRVRATLERESGDHAAAMATLSEARGLAREAEDALLVAEVVRDLGDVLRLRGDRTAAEEAFREARAGFARLGALRGALDVESRLAGAA